MGIFQRLFGSAGGAPVEFSPEAATRFPAAATTKSGLTEEAEKAVMALALTRDFRGLDLALRHPSPPARAFAVGFVAVAGRVQPTAGGGASFEISSSGDAIGKCDARAVAMLKKAAKDPDPTVRSRAEEELERAR